MVKKFVFMAISAFVLSACGDAAEQAEKLRSKADAAIEGQGLVDAVASAVDEEAIKGMANGAARQALGDVLPAEEMAAVGAVIDEEALISGLDKAVDGEALRGAVREVVKGAGGPPTQPPAE